MKHESGRAKCEIIGSSGVWGKPEAPTPLTAVAICHTRMWVQPFPVFQEKPETETFMGSVLVLKLGRTIKTSLASWVYLLAVSQVFHLPL